MIKSYIPHSENLYTFQNTKHYIKIVYSRGTKVTYHEKTHFFAPERYTAGFLYTDSLNSAGYESTVKQCYQNCISRKNAFLYVT